MPKPAPGRCRPARSSSWSRQVILPTTSVLTARAINGIHNRSASRAGPPGRSRVLPAAGCVAPFATFRCGQHPAGEAWDGGGGDAHPDRRARAAQSVDQDLQFVRRTLGVTPDQNGEVSVSFGLLPRGPSEIALLTRSMAGNHSGGCAAGIRSACGPCRAGPHGRFDARGRFRGPTGSPLCSYPIVCVPAGRQLRSPPPPRHLDRSGSTTAASPRSGSFHSC